MTPCTFYVLVEAYSEPGVIHVAYSTRNRQDASGLLRSLRDQNENPGVREAWISTIRPVDADAK